VAFFSHLFYFHLFQTTLPHVDCKGKKDANMFQKKSIMQQTANCCKNVDFNKRKLENISVWEEVASSKDTSYIYDKIKKNFKFRNLFFYLSCTIYKIKYFYYLTPHHYNEKWIFCCQRDQKKTFFPCKY